eukprot:TRINITY_DN4233_c0_g1_i1.p1 TRINITY_DN4233_c0_g1~~TRINITY_DN4233_c0_g1_i1.p1  ORF type:complete len:1285 (-),score=374.88 TRINITY_DN4233_c0_g1_i1:315-4169(-)
MSSYGFCFSERFYLATIWMMDGEPSADDIARGLADPATCVKALVNLECHISKFATGSFCPQDDLRRNEQLWLLLQRALLLGDDLANRIALRSIRVFVESSVSMPASEADAFAWSEVAELSNTNAPRLLPLFRTLFVALEVLSNPVIHLIREVFLDAMNILLEPDCPLHISWVETLLAKGFQHQNIAVRKMVMHSAFSSQRVFSVQFVTSHMMSCLSDAVMLRGVNSCVRSAVVFFSEYVGRLHTAQTAFLFKRLLRKVMEVTRCEPQLLFMEWLKAAPIAPLYDDEDMQIAAQLLTQRFSTTFARVRTRLMTHALEGLAHGARAPHVKLISMEPILDCAARTGVLTQPQAAARAAAVEWLQQPELNVASSLADNLRTFLDTPTSLSVETQQGRCRGMALVFLLAPEVSAVALQPIVEALSRVHSYMYAPVGMAFRAMLFFDALMVLAPQQAEELALRIDGGGELSGYVQARFNADPEDVEFVLETMWCVQTLGHAATLLRLPAAITTVKKLQSHALELLSKRQPATLYGLSRVIYAQSLFDSSVPLCTTDDAARVAIAVATCVQPRPQLAHSDRDVLSAADNTLHLKRWRCVHQLIQQFLDSFDTDAMHTLFETALDAIEATPSNAVAALLVVIADTLPNAFSSAEERRAAVPRLVKPVMQMMEYQFFKSHWHFLAKPVVDVVFHPCIASDDELLAAEDNALFDAFDRLMYIAEQTPDMANVLAAKLIRVLQAAPHVAVCYAEKLASLCMFGPIRETMFAPRSVVLSAAPGTYPPISLHAEDYIVRAAVLQYLRSLPASQASTDVATALARVLLRRSCDRDVNTTHCPPGCFSYRIRLRIWQAMVMIVPHLDTVAIADDIAAFMWPAFAQTIPSSVRLYMEMFAAGWCLVCVEAITAFLLPLAHDVEGRPQTATSVLLLLRLLVAQLPLQNLHYVGRHVAVIATAWLAQGNHAVRAASVLLMEAMVARVARDPEAAVVLGLDGFGADILQGAITFAQTNVKAVKDLASWRRYTGDLEVRPLLSVSVPQMILALAPLYAGGEHIPEAIIEVALRDGAEAIAPDNVVVEDIEADDDVPVLDTPSAAQQSDGSAAGNYQLKGNEPSAATDASSAIAAATSAEPALRPPPRPLIVVGSLVEKAPNLAGLTRTVEVFGAQQLLIPSMSILQDPQYKNISVSAERWAPIAECAPADLPAYLALKRSEGFTIVGVEQTADSIPLHQFEFPERTVLVMGHEKEGMPGRVINLMDHCVVIPQRGIIRSLNVHVCAAVVMWEYTQQQEHKATKV